MAQNFMDLALDGALKKHSQEHSDKAEKQLEEDYRVATRVTREILGIFEKHQVSPMQGYMIAGALSDAIYAMIVENNTKQSLMPPSGGNKE